MTNKLKSLLRRRRVEHLLPRFTERGIADWSFRNLRDCDLCDLSINDVRLRGSLLAGFEKASRIKPLPGTMVEVKRGVLLLESELWGTKFWTFWIGVYGLTMGEW